jgi:lipopolysaccharide/colanic/teichoic acid biosynthesis glycosyltransferase
MSKPPSVGLSKLAKFVVRCLDLVVGTILLLLSLPVILAAAMAIRFESKGSPFFVQTRIGLNGKLFKIFKLRGMYQDAREKYPDLYDYQRFGTLGFYFHYENDPRVTAVGAFIRRTSIDELPNFLNVVLGSMTLIGPRPEVPEVQSLYGKYSDKYLSVKPGITCISKVSGRDRLTKEESILLDLEYVDNISLKMNARIFWKTMVSVLGRENVFHGRRRTAAILLLESPERSPRSRRTSSHISTETEPVVNEVRVRAVSTGSRPS